MPLLHELEPRSGSLSKDELNFLRWGFFIDPVFEVMTIVVTPRDPFTQV
jgi:hypothetical protein